jgi:carboxymethylenebutenolidase
LELVPQSPGRLWCFCGDADPLMAPEELTAIERALRAANGGQDPASPQARHRLLIAPGAGHGYMCAARGDYHPDAAAAGWSALLELLAGSL